MNRRQFILMSSALGVSGLFGRSVYADDHDLDALYAAAKKEGKVVMYTSVPTFLLDQWKTLFSQQFPGIEFEYFRSGTGKIQARIATEARAGRIGGDLVWLADPTAFDTLIEQKLLAAYKPPELAHIDLLKNPDGFFTTGRILVGCLLTNPQAGGGNVTSFADLAKPEMKGKVCIASPLVSGSTNMIDAALWQNPDFGWDYFKKLQENNVLVLNDVPDVARSVASGERAAGISLTLFKYQPEFANSPMQIVMPKEGVITMASPLGLFAESPQPNAGKLLYRFLLSKEAQAVLSSAGIYPARTDVPPPVGLPPFAQLVNLQPDYAWAVAHKAENQQKWRALFGG